MTGNSERRRLLSVLQQLKKNSGWDFALGIMLFGVFLSGSAQAAVFTVNNLSDVSDDAPGNGVCEIVLQTGDCTLRAAIEEANALVGSDQIILPSLSPPNAYVLNVVTGLTITDHLTITGGGATTTIIDGNKGVRPNGGVLHIFTGTVNISGVTIRNGATTGFGGGIFNLGTLTLTNSTVSGNSAVEGGGIRNSGTLTLANSTVSGNSATGSGGGIFNFDGTVSLFNATITSNNLAAFSSGSGAGVSTLGSTFNFRNTILAGNFIFLLPGPPFTSPSDCAGTINSSGNNLMQSLSGCTVNGGVVIGGGVTVAAPQLGPLQNNGGPTQTHAPLPGSPAIDAGNSFGCRDQFGDLLLKDQRGLRRTVDGNRDGTARCDIGAVEFGSGAGVTFYSDVDFDGDGRNDIGVYRDGTWFIVRSSDGGVTATAFGGLPQDLPVPGDYEGDGKTDQAVYRDGVWIIRRSFDGGTSVFQWGGLLEDIPVPGDYDGDGKTDVAVYRNGAWLIVRSFDGEVTGVGWGGLPQDVPVPADYDGDGRTDFAVYREGTWFILLANGGVIATGWGGLPQDIPVPGDYDGDGKTDLAVYRDGLWFILRSSDGGVTVTGWGGLSQDVLVPGDYDGDRKTDVAVYRDGNWHIVRSFDGGVTSIGWGGVPQDIPLSRRND